MAVSDRGTNKHTALKATPAHSRWRLSKLSTHRASSVRSEHQGQRPPYSKMKAYTPAEQWLFKGRGHLSHLTQVREPSLTLVSKKMLTSYLTPPPFPAPRKHRERSEHKLKMRRKSQSYGIPTQMIKKAVSCSLSYLSWRQRQSLPGYGRGCLPGAAQCPCQPWSTPSPRPWLRRHLPKILSQNPKPRNMQSLVNKWGEGWEPIIGPDPLIHNRCF